MAYTPATRNFTGIPFESLKRKIDSRYNAVHDALSAAYYDGKVFSNGKYSVDFGKLKESDPKAAKALFDKLHALVWQLYIVLFHAENQSLDAKSAIPETEYNAKDDSGKTPVEIALAEIDSLKAEGIVLTL